MSKANPTLPYLAMRVIFEESPDVIEIETRVVDDDWQGRTTSYGKHGELHDAARKLGIWSARPEGEAIVEIGFETGAGWLRLSFYEIDNAGHLACYIQMSERVTESGPRIAKPSKMALEMRTEAGLIEQFARNLARISEEYPEAVLNGIY